jgi:hypothetical protein
VDEEGNPKVSNRTVNLDVIGLRCVMKDAMNDGLIQWLPMEGMKPLDEVETNRPLFTSGMLDKLCCVAVEIQWHNAQPVIQSTLSVLGFPSAV